MRTQSATESGTATFSIRALNCPASIFETCPCNLGILQITLWHRPPLVLLDASSGEGVAADAGIGEPRHEFTSGRAGMAPRVRVKRALEQVMRSVRETSELLHLSVQGTVNVRTAMDPLLEGAFARTEAADRNLAVQNVAEPAQQAAPGRWPHFTRHNCARELPSQGRTYSRRAF